MSDFKRSVAVVIGIDKYQGDGIKPLKSAKADAQRLADILEQEPHSFEVERLIDEEATSENLSTCLEKLKQQMPDRLLFYFAGHALGQRNEDLEGGHLLMQKSQLLDQTDWYSMKKLYDDFVMMLDGDNINLSSNESQHSTGLRHLLIILDCCYAGSFRSTTREVEYNQPEITKESFTRYVNKKAAQVIASSAHNEVAADQCQEDKADNGDKQGSEDSDHSPFAKLLFEALEDNAADFTKDGIKTAQEISLHIDKKLPKLGPGQTCNTWKFPKYDQGEFFFFSKDFDENNLVDAIEINDDNNPYRGLKSFDEAHHRFFFGRNDEVDELTKQMTADNPCALTVVRGASGSGKSSFVKAGLLPKLRKRSDWLILEPIRLGSDPFEKLARAMLQLNQLKTYFQNIQRLNKLEEFFRKVLNKDTSNSDIKLVFNKLRRSSPTEKFKRVARSYKLIKQLLTKYDYLCELSHESFDELFKFAITDSEVLLDEDFVKQLTSEHESADQNIEITDRVSKNKKSVSQWKQDWRMDPKIFVNYLFDQLCMNSQQGENKDVKVLLVIDQFEELLACPNDKNDFLKLLLEVLKAKHLHKQFRILLTIRSDLAFAFVKKKDELYNFWSDGSFSLGPIRYENIRTVIEQPALVQGVYFESSESDEPNKHDLVKKIIKEVGFDTSGILPLLSFALQKTFSEFATEFATSDKSDRTLKVTHFENAGGVLGAVTNEADKLYNNLSFKCPAINHDKTAPKKMLKKIMLRMVDYNGLTNVKRKVFENELSFQDEGDNKLKDCILKQLLESRLVLKDKGKPGKDKDDETYYELIHDCLITQWQKYREWLNDDDQADDLNENRQEVDDVKPVRTIVKLGSKLILSQPSQEGIVSSGFNLELQRRLTKAANEWSKKNEKPQGPPTKNDQSSAIAWIAHATSFLTLPLRKDRDGLWAHDPDLANLALVASSGTDNWLNKTESKFVKASLALKTFNARRNWTLAFSVMAGLSVATVVADYQRKVSNIRAEHALALNQMSATPVEALIRSLALSGKSYLQALAKFDYLGEDALLQVLNQIDDVGWGESNRLNGHKGLVNSVALSPDGRRIVSGSDDKTIRIWEWDDAKAKFNFLTLKGNEAPVTSVAFSPDGRRIVSGSEDGTIMLWDAASGKRIGSGLHSKERDRLIVRTSVAFSRDGRRIVSGRSSTLQLWEGSSLKHIDKPLESKNRGSMESVAFSPDGRRIISVIAKKLELWDTEKRKVLRSFEYNKNFVTSVAFSPDGGRIAFGTDDDIVIILNSATGETIGSPPEGHKSSVISVAFSPDGKRIVTASGDKTLRIWDATNGKPIGLPLQGHTNWVSSVAFSPDGHRIVSGSWDGTLRLWDTVAGRSISSSFQGHKDDVNSVAFSPDGRFIVSGSSDKTLRIWNAASGKSIEPPLVSHETRVNSVAFSPDGQRIVSGFGDWLNGGSQVALWDVDKLSWKTIGSPRERHTGSEVNSVAFSPDGRRIVSGSDDKTLRLWDVASGKLIGEPLVGHAKAVRSVAFSPDGRRLVSGSNDNTLRIWNLDDAKTKTLKGHTWRVTSVAFSPDGQRIVSGSDDNTLRLWDVGSGKPIGLPLQPISDSVRSVAFSRDGRRIVSGFGDGSMRIWDGDSGQPIGPPIQGGGINMKSVAFSPDGFRIVSGSGGCFDQRCGGSDMRMWDINPSRSINLACQRLSRHPLLLYPETFNVGSEFEDIARRARAICDLHRAAPNKRGLFFPSSAAVLGRLRIFTLSRLDKVR
jgi:WD40 repeat protein